MSIDNLNEPILDDDYLVYFEYCYIIDGKMERCPLYGPGMKVRDLKRAFQATEVRRCDLVGRGLL